MTKTAAHPHRVPAIETYATCSCNTTPWRDAQICKAGVEVLGLDLPGSTQLWTPGVRVVDVARALPETREQRLGIGGGSGPQTTDERSCPMSGFDNMICLGSQHDNRPNVSNQPSHGIPISFARDVPRKY